MPRSRRDLYAEITERVLAMLREGTAPWQRPWKALGLQRNLQRRRPYRGLNQLLLQIRQLERSYASPYWTTYRAAKAAGGHVRRGERGTLVTFWKFVERRDRDEGEEAHDGHRVPLLRTYTVFNLDQTDGLETPHEGLGEFEPIERCRRIIEEMPDPPAIQHGGDRACYMPGADVVRLPVPEAFEPAEAYYAAAFHELVHSTAHPRRLDRDVGGHRFGSADYSREELVAELGAAMLCAVGAIDPAVVDNSAAYIANWLEALSDDERMVVVAAGKAQRAADYILGVDVAESGGPDAPEARAEVAA